MWMNGHIQKATQNMIEKMWRYQDIMNRFEEEPLILLTELFKEEDYTLPSLIQLSGDEALLEVQTYWFQHLFPALRQYIGLEGVTFSYNSSLFPSPIHIHLGEDEVALLEIISHTFQRVEPKEMTEKKQKLAEIKEMLVAIQEELEQKEPALKNPLVLGGGNVVKLMDIAIRNKKYKKETLQAVQKIQNDFFELDRERIHLESQIQQMKERFAQRDYLIDKVEQRIRQLPGYQAVPFFEEMEVGDVQISEED